MDDKPGGISFMEYIEEHYYLQKSKLQRICNKLNSFIFDEDIFHDTILKVHESFKNQRHHHSVYEKYLMESFKRNLIREKLYHRNMMTNYVESFDEVDQPIELSYIEYDIDFKIVMNVLKKKFGEVLAQCYIDWLSGYEIKELIEKHNINSGYYYIKQMTKYLISYYK